METAIAIVVLVLGLTLLWSGRRQLEFSSFVTVLLSVAELVGFVVSALALGWVGIAILIGVNVVAVLIWSVILAARKQAILTSASVEGADLSEEQAEEIWRWMGGERSFAAIAPLKRAELVRALAAHARSAAEIRPISVAVAKLAMIFGYDPLWLAPRFDRLLRLYGKDAADSAEVADTVTSATQQAAATFEEMVEAMLVVGDGSAAEVGAGKGAEVSQGVGFWENLRSQAELQVHADGEGGIRLNGGPMDRWLVKPDAPSLHADWYRTWPPSIAGRHGPGRYRVADSGTWAEWTAI